MRVNAACGFGQRKPSLKKKTKPKQEICVVFVRQQRSLMMSGAKELCKRLVSILVSFSHLAKNRTLMTQ